MKITGTINNDEEVFVEIDDNTTILTGALVLECKDWKNINIYK